MKKTKPLPSEKRLNEIVRWKEAVAIALVRASRYLSTSVITYRCTVSVTVELTEQDKVETTIRYSTKTKRDAARLRKWFVADKDGNSAVVCDHGLFYLRVDSPK